MSDAHDRMIQRKIYLYICRLELECVFVIMVWEPRELRVSLASSDAPAGLVVRTWMLGSRVSKILSLVHIAVLILMFKAREGVIGSVVPSNEVLLFLSPAPTLLSDFLLLLCIGH